MTKSRQERPLIELITQPKGLVAATEFDLDYIRQYRTGSRILCEITQPKDPRLERFFHSMVAVVADAIGEDPEALRQRIKYRAKLIRGVEIFDGATHIITKSMRDLDQAELQRFVETARHVIQTEILPGCDVETLMIAARRYVGQKEPA